ncbi:hypothetical protein FC093_14530 [Ilyomonas limi]|uniref:Uncharacterized protein n=1 Tax=Ilyomonas limi TaxID=2575867 RepID=A0A4U3KXW5_9BACT|nr:hypothetical protein [Ilyomonas limi]TKK67501.1 hypothetical protein FC093_14530 [Ilyomonas limi]
MKLNNRLVVVITILLFITIHHTYSKQETSVKHTKYASEKAKDSIISADFFSPGKIIFVKLP